MMQVNMSYCSLKSVSKEELACVKFMGSDTELRQAEAICDKCKKLYPIEGLEQSCK